MNNFLPPSLIWKNDTKLILLVIDGLGGTTNEEGFSELDVANLPNLNELASKSSCGLHIPVDYGITPGSAPGHLALFGYDPVKYQIGRGILEALGVGLEVRHGDLAVRGNFSTLKDGKIVDRRAGRIPTEECERLVKKLSEKIKLIEDVKVIMKAGLDYRFAVVFRGKELSDKVTDADPQINGMPPEPAKPLTIEAEKTARIINKFIKLATEVLSDEPVANTVILRGYAKYPHIESFDVRYGLDAAGIATYPMYRGLASLVGMKTIDVTGFSIEEEFRLIKEIWPYFDFFFVHVKKTDSLGEDGDFEGKVKKLEEIDGYLPILLELSPDVMVVTGDHATPAVLKSHSWHPVPVLLWSKYAFRDDVKKFCERECAKGILGTIPALAIMPLMLANALRLKKFGA